MTIAAQQTTADFRPIYDLAPDVVDLIARQSKRSLTHCRICGQSLRDPKSVSLGIGPVCRKNCAYKATMDAVRKDLQPLATAALRSLSANTGTTKADAMAVCPELRILRALGFDKIASAVERRMAVVVITYTDADRIEIDHTFAPSLFDELRRIPGRTVALVKGRKAHSIPASSRSHLTAVLRACLPGQLGWSSKGGLFQVLPEGSNDWRLAGRADGCRFRGDLSSVDRPSLGRPTGADGRRNHATTGARDSGTGRALRLGITRSGEHD